MQRKNHEILQQASKPSKVVSKDSIELPIPLNESQPTPAKHVNDNAGDTSPDGHTNGSPRQDGSIHKVIYKDVNGDAVPHPSLDTEIQSILIKKERRKCVTKSNLQTNSEQESPAQRLSDTGMVENIYYETYC